MSPFRRPLANARELRKNWRAGETAWATIAGQAVSPLREGSIIGCETVSPAHRDSLTTPQGAGAFDRVAARYDELWTNSAIGRAQRDLVWQHVNPLFQPGDRILDVGCGTGEDAAHFITRGISVHVTDPSTAMLEIAKRRAKVGGGRLTIGLQDDILPHTLDGAISNFGALNCADDLPSVARDLARVVRPGGRIAICVIGRFCLWESVYYSVRLEFSKAFRRLRGSAPSSLGITIHYPTVRALGAAFTPDFELQRFAGIGLFVPPSYVPLPAPVVRLLAAVDRVLARLPLLRSLADHRLLIFVRK